MSSVTTLQIRICETGIRPRRIGMNKSKSTYTCNDRIYIKIKRGCPRRRQTQVRDSHLSNDVVKGHDTINAGSVVRRSDDHPCAFLRLNRLVLWRKLDRRGNWPI